MFLSDIHHCSRKQSEGKKEMDEMEGKRKKAWQTNGKPKSSYRRLIGDDSVKYCWPRAPYWLTMTASCVPAQQMNWRAKDSYRHHGESPRSVDCVLLWCSNLVHYLQSGLLSKQTSRSCALIKTSAPAIAFNRIINRWHDVYGMQQ